jgi:hypothetical protein
VAFKENLFTPDLLVVGLKGQTPSIMAQVCQPYPEDVFKTKNDLKNSIDK